MSGVQLVTVSENDEGVRLDRWFKRQFPGLGHGHLEKMLRKRQIKVDGGRAKTSTRLEAGQEIRIPPLDPILSESMGPKALSVSPADVADLQGRVLYRDKDVLAINKPAGLAVQGGSNTRRHLDGMLDVLQFDSEERPRLVHRLDKDTSGVLLLGRNARSTAALTEAFREKETGKTYWALVYGEPAKQSGQISFSLAKRQSQTPGKRGERVEVDMVNGKPAVTNYKVLDVTEFKGMTLSWVRLEPLTGRTHQLRVHMAAMGSPIVGDGKYSDGRMVPEGFSKNLYLHAQKIRLPGSKGKSGDIEAPLPPHMIEVWDKLGFKIS
jgi:23S rRNA pseudouridine955/2504/2580 synthase